MNQGVFDTMGPTVTWEYVGKISPAIPTLRKLVDHMEDTVNNYWRYKKHTTRSTEDDVARLMVMFQESALYRHVNEREVEARERFADIWARGFEIVLKGESLKRWFKNRSESQFVADGNIAGDDGVAGDGDVAGDYDDVMSSELEEMEFGDDCEFLINLHHHAWPGEFTTDDVPS